MAGARITTTLATLLALVLSLSGKCSAQEIFSHHVVGDDRGWDTTSDVASWAATRIFLVGDTLWFMYSAAQEKVVEVGSREEYEACDLRNPMRMYSDGLSKISLDAPGTRFFLSGDTHSCHKGLKLPVQVQVQPQPPTLASPPFSPSASSPVSPTMALLLGAFLAWLLLLQFPN